MNKKIKMLFIILSMITLSFLFASCDHTHSFTCMVATKKYLNSTATCNTKATYYYSCVCGKKGVETFGDGEFAEHDFKNNQSCTQCNASYGLEYKLNDDGTAYRVMGMGACTDTDVIVPNSYNKKPVIIDDYAFVNCSNITSITIGSYHIFMSDFDNCPNLANILVDEANIAFKSIDGNLYTKDEKTLIRYTPGKTATTFVVPDSVTRISHNAFRDCTSLTEVIIPNSVKSIGYGAFRNCTSLTEVIIPNSESIGYGAFGNCTNLTSVVLGNGITDIESYAFEHCPNLMTIVIPKSLKNIGERAFNHSLNLMFYCEAIMPQSGWHSGWNVGNWPIVYNCANNDVANDGYIYTMVDGIRYAIKDGVATLLRQPTNYTTANIASTITYKGTVYSVTSIGKGAFKGNQSIQSVAMPNGVTMIDDEAFAYSSLKSITIPNSVTKIGQNAFSSCWLTSIIIPNSVTEIGESAFSSCARMTSVTISNNLTKIPKYAFAGCQSLTQITIPDSVTQIGDFAFNACYRLVEVINKSQHITITQGSWDNGAIGLYALSLFNGEETVNSKLSVDDGYVIYTDGEEKILVGYNGFLTDLVAPYYVTKIKESAFSGWHLTSIVISNNVTSIEKNAFNRCENLTIYYKGSLNDWNKIDISSQGNDDLLNATIYFYSLTQPTDDGNYWHYDTDGKTPVVWSKED